MKNNIEKVYQSKRVIQFKGGYQTIMVETHVTNDFVVQSFKLRVEDHTAIIKRSFDRSIYSFNYIVERKHDIWTDSLTGDKYEVDFYTNQITD